MRVIGASSEDEMVLAFLRAEFYSPRFGPFVRDLLGGSRALLDNPDLDDVAENATRKGALARVRGYGVDDLIFRGFPTDAQWLRVMYAVREVGEMRYANYPTWVTLSGGSRVVKDGAENVLLVQTAEDDNRNIIAVQRRVAAGERFPELILAAETDESVPIVVEGHTRATAYVRAANAGALPGDTEVEGLLGVSQRLRHWAFA